MKSYNMHEAKSQLSKLVEQALSGEETIIARAGKAVVKLIPCDHPAKPRELGLMKGKIQISSDFDDPLEEITNLFETTEIEPEK